MTDGTATSTFTYDANGMRTKRWSNGILYEYVYTGSQLSQVIIDGWQNLKFTYEANGMPMMVTYNGTNYYYIVNLQGDVMGIMDGAGNVIVNYTYDAWGKPLSVTGTMASTLGTLNPLRYRGYVYDQETGFYYLQSRYYDPEIGRFINADAFASTGQGFIGNNMFAYCLNNPVSRYDPSGGFSCFMYSDGSDNPFSIHSMCMGIGGGGAGAGGGLVGKANIQREIDYLNNTDPQVVLESEFLSFYHGVPVLKVNFGDGGGLSFGIILLDDDYTNNTDGLDALNHEYGHRLHMDDIGVVNYLFTTAVPSFLGATLKTLKVIDVHYYSLPWEYVADLYGGVNRVGYEAWASIEGARFLLYTLTVASITDSITDIFTGGIR